MIVSAETNKIAEQRNRNKFSLQHQDASVGVLLLVGYNSTVTPSAVDYRPDILRTLLMYPPLILILNSDSDSWAVYILITDESAPSVHMIKTESD